MFNIVSRGLVSSSPRLLVSSGCGAAPSPAGGAKRPGMETVTRQEVSARTEHAHIPRHLRSPRAPSRMSSAGGGSALQVHAVRFGPGQELLGSLQAFVQERRLRAPFILTCVGSVTKATLRLANATATNTNETLHLSGQYEIVSLVGTVNPEAHLHICLSDGEGGTIGGHVLGGLEVFTTAEVVVGEAVDLQFTRELDVVTGFPELVVERRRQEKL